MKVRDTMATAKAKDAEISIQEIRESSMEFCILGTSPLIMNRMSQKAWFELLAPQKKTRGDKENSLKHDPRKEFRDAPYRLADPKAPTLLALLPTMFKRAMGTASLDTPGATKSQMLRLLRVDWDRTPVFGIPKLFMAITRSADVARTPDVRTRAIMAEWACHVKVTFPASLIRESSVANLMGTAGRYCGVGDWRQEKGSGSFGAFMPVSADNPDFRRIVENGGREAQIKAMNNPQAYDDETSDMLAWFDAEVLAKRGFKEAASSAAGDGGEPWSRSGDFGLPPDVVAGKSGRKSKGNGAHA